MICSETYAIAGIATLSYLHPYLYLPKDYMTKSHLLWKLSIVVFSFLLWTFLSFWYSIHGRMWNNESISRKRRAAHQEDKLYTDHCEKVMYLDMCFGLWLLSLCTQGYVNFTENAVFRYNDIQRQMVCQIRRQAWEYFSNNKIFNNAMSMSTLQRENNFLIWISHLEILNDSYWYFPGLL